MYAYQSAVMIPILSCRHHRLNLNLNRSCSLQLTSVMSWISCRFSSSVSSLVYFSSHHCYSSILELSLEWIEQFSRRNCLLSCHHLPMHYSFFRPSRSMNALFFYLNNKNNVDLSECLIFFLSIDEKRTATKCRVSIRIDWFASLSTLIRRYRVTLTNVDVIEE